MVSHRHLRLCGTLPGPQGSGAVDPEAGAARWERSVRWDWVQEFLGMSLVGFKGWKERSLQVIAKALL